jgi:ABC-type cobalamin/Fe3+-siderophores transport system ATPase subunit
MSFPVKPFNVNVDPTTGTSWGLIGPSKSGKTTLMKYIYNEYYSKHITLMFSQNKHADIYKDLGKSVIIYDDYNGKIIKDAHDINVHTKNKFPFLIITDDIVGNKLKNDQELLRLGTIYRNSGQSSIQSLQDPVLMSSTGRNQANYICIFKQQTPKKWEFVIKEFLSMFFPPGMSMREMMAYCKSCTEPKGQFFFIDNITGDCYLTKLSKGQI